MEPEQAEWKCFPGRNRLFKCSHDGVITPTVADDGDAGMAATIHEHLTQSGVLLPKLGLNVFKALRMKVAVKLYE